MKEINNGVKQNTFANKGKLTLVVVVSCIVACLAMTVIANSASNKAYADPQSEANSVMDQINAKTGELNSISEEYNNALNDLNEAKAKVNEARAKIDEANKAIKENQGHLSDQMVDMYKNKGTSTILDWFLNIDSLNGFLDVWDSVEKLNQDRANTIAACKYNREVVQESSASLEENAKIAADREASARAKKDAAQNLVGELQAKYNHLTDEAKAQAQKAAEDRERQTPSGGGGGGGGGGDHPATGSIVADRALAERGKPYAWGAVGPFAYDCSGLVSYALTGRHVRVGSASTFFNWPASLNPSAGDICATTGHCGVYIGGGQMCHAPTFGQVVCVAPVQKGMKIVH